MSCILIFDLLLKKQFVWIISPILPELGTPGPVGRAAE